MDIMATVMGILIVHPKYCGSVRVVAIIWTDYIYLRISASLGLNELR